MENTKMNHLINVEKLNPLDVFTVNGIEPVLKAIHEKVGEFEPDTSTNKGRKEIASMANDVARSKTLLDGLGKDLVSEWKSKAKVVDASRKKIRDDLDNLKEEVRAPLAQWEQVEKTRIADHEIFVAGFLALSLPVSPYTIETLKENLKIVESMLVGEHLEEYELDAIKAKAKSIESLTSNIKQMEIKEAEHAELERLRKDAEARTQKDHEERIAKEATEKAKAEAELNARLKAEEQAEKVEKEKQKALEEKKQLAQKVEREKQKILDDKKQLEQQAKQAEIDKKKALQDAKNREEQAAQRERDQIESERLKQVEAQQKREADLKHRKAINNDALKALLEFTSLDEKIGKEVITAIASGQIPHTQIKY